MKQPTLSWLGWQGSHPSFLYAGRNQIGVVDTDSLNRYVGIFYPNRTLGVTEDTCQGAKDALEKVVIKWFEESFKERD